MDRPSFDPAMSAQPALQWEYSDTGSSPSTSAWMGSLRAGRSPPVPWRSAEKTSTCGSF